MYKETMSTIKHLLLHQRLNSKKNNIFKDEELVVYRKRFFSAVHVIHIKVNI